ncbi:uncharacterized protein ELE39_000105 [Cryptosporidium sp. chipmunk genotype I]|uniref:uncharacterized protein n=1 Tax=Cryptosporidium sp. chipmunk genotype I TaxID=1280935 RepID=UPI00351A0BC2|nr:hypothetical protein ELE39_000105 [Cryptosporidium sp. chipmunk genotype I]
MRNILFLVLSLVIFIISYSDCIESTSINDSSGKVKTNTEVQGVTSKVTTSEPTSTDSSQQKGRVTNYMDEDKLLKGRISSWNRLITLIINNVKAGENWQSILSIKSNEYFKYNSPQRVPCSDHYAHEVLPEKFFNVISSVPVHFPTEVKDKRIVLNIKRTPNLNLQDSIKFSNFPRVKHFRKSLVILPPEPYQRLMTYAIEQCLIPSIWYLELIHCMYIGMAPKFFGMVFSYTLQDIVGAALMSISYKDEHFIMENCFNAVSLVVDDYVSPYYVEICTNVRTCLESKNFERSFSKQKEEFETRIANSYNHIPEKPGFLKPTQFYRYSILLSISLLKYKNIDLKTFPERGFLPIRIALASLAYYAISSSQSWVFESEKKVSVFFTKMILKMLFEVSLLSIPGCIEKLYKFSHETEVGKKIIFELFCKEIFSAGFIVEATNESSADPKLYSKAVMPQRILNPLYCSFIPNFTSDVERSEDESWIYAQIEVSKPTVVRPDQVQEVYQSKKLKKTIRKDCFKDGVGPQSMDTSFRRVKTGKMTKLGFRSLTNKLLSRRRNK